MTMIIITNTGTRHGGKTLSLNLSLLEKNDRLAEQNRGFFRAKKLLVLNVVSSPGSGKTTFIRETAAKLAGRLRLGVIVGDLATDNDAARCAPPEFPSCKSPPARSVIWTRTWSQGRGAIGSGPARRAGD
jgi:hypothetical protein